MREAVRRQPHAGHQSFDLLEHRVQAFRQPIEFVAAAALADTAGQIAPHDLSRRLRHAVDPRQHAPAEEDSAQQSQGERRRQRPGERFDDDAAELRLLVHVAADQQPVAAGELEGAGTHLVPDGTGAVPPDQVEADPFARRRGARWPCRQISRESTEYRVDQQVDAVAALAGALADDLHETGEVALLVLLGEALDLRLDRRRRLTVDDLHRRPVDEPENGHAPTR